MKIGILQTGRRPDELADTYEDYDAFFMALMADSNFDIVSYPVLDGIFPDAATDADGWLITGSRFGAYEDHPWIPPLEALIREIAESNLPLIGVCFGHQIIAQALGGKVEKFAGGWALGPTDYTGPNGKTLRLNAWHQDQVVEKPEGSVCLAGNDFCENAVLAYGDTILTIQAHPEFSLDFVRDLFTVRRNVLPTETAEQLDKTLQDIAPAQNIAATFDYVFHRKGPLAAAFDNL